MKQQEFLRILRRRTASVAVSPSAGRKMGPSGTVRAARRFLAENVSLKVIGASGQQFPELLDDLTRKLVRALPKKAQHWGAARKFLNIYIRDATYNVYLRDKFRLSKVEGYLEVPIDRQVSDELRNNPKHDIQLPVWKSVISLNSKQNKKYQDAAKQVAEKENIKSVHFDVIAWRKKSDYL